MKKLFYYKLRVTKFFIKSFILSEGYLCKRNQWEYVLVIKKELAMFSNKRIQKEILYGFLFKHSCDIKVSNYFFNFIKLTLELYLELICLNNL